MLVDGVEAERVDGIVFQDDQPVVVAADPVAEQIVRVDPALDQVASPAAALGVFNQRFYVASLVGRHVADLEVEEQRGVERHAVFLHGQLGARPLLPVRGVDGHVAATRKAERIFYIRGIVQVVEPPAAADGQRVKTIEGHPVKLGCRFVDGLIHAQ